MKTTIRLFALLALLLTAAPGWAQFPTVTHTNSSLTNTGSTSIVVSLPATVTAGQRLIAAIGADGSGSFDWSSATGWTELYDQSTSGECHLTVGQKIADGTEGGTTITVTASGADKAAHQSFAISGHNPAIAPQASAESETLDPASLIPTGGVKAYLWLTFACIDGGVDITGAPANYTNLIFNESSVGSASGLASARRNLTASSEDPGAFTQGGAEGGNSVTIAVHPAEEESSQVIVVP